MAHECLEKRGLTDKRPIIESGIFPRKFVLILLSNTPAHDFRASRAGPCPPKYPVAAATFASMIAFSSSSVMRSTPRRGRRAYSRSRAITSSGSELSEKPVKPRRSQKSAVIFRRWLRP